MLFFIYFILHERIHDNIPLQLKGSGVQITRQLQRLQTIPELHNTDQGDKFKR